MMKPICMIIPPSIFLMDERVFVSLGILRVAACLEQSGFVVEMLDLSGVQNYDEAAKAHAAQSKATTYCITSTTPQMPQAIKIADAIKSVLPIAKLIIGGPHPTLVAAAMKLESKIGVKRRAHRAMDSLLNTFNVVVAGDGEFAIFEALQNDAPRLIDADNPKTELFLNNKALNDLPFPARHLVDIKSYKYEIEGKRALSMIAQLGCPYTCTFCGGRNSAMLRRVRTRTTENVVAEIRHLYTKYNYEGLMMYDDELNVNPQMLPLMSSINDLQKELGAEFRLRGFLKAQLFKDEQAEAMVKAGFRWILVGFESGSPRILENIRKMSTREENTRCIEIARRHGLKTKALMSIGHAGESEETITETKQWLLEMKPDDFDCTIITTYPGSPYYDAAIPNGSHWTFTAKNGDRLHAHEVDYNVTADYYKGMLGEYKAYVYTDHLTSGELVELRDDLENTVRKELNIPFNPSRSGVQFEASMGQLPGYILKATDRR